MTASEPFPELLAWHERWLKASESQDWFSAMFQQMSDLFCSLRFGPSRPVRETRRAALARLEIAKEDLLRAFPDAWEGLHREAEDRLREIGTTGRVSWRLGTPGEWAEEHIRDLRAGRKPERPAGTVLDKLISSGRLIAPAAGQCIKCHVVRPIEQLDIFTSTSSGETIHVCHGRQPAPEDRLGLRSWPLWDDHWGWPCADLS